MSNNTSVLPRKEAPSGTGCLMAVGIAIIVMTLVVAVLAV